MTREKAINIILYHKHNVKEGSQIDHALDMAISALRRSDEDDKDYDYERASDMRDYCERYEPTYNPDDGSM